MAKIVFANIPAYGHTNPTLAVVRTLAERGHQILYYSGEEMRDAVEAAGAEFRGYPQPMPHLNEVTEALKELITTTLLLIKISEAHTAWFIEQMRLENPQLILYDSTAQWGYVAARVLDIPHICSITTFVLRGSQGNLPAAALGRFLIQAVVHLPRLLRWRRFMVKHFGKDHVGGITEYARRNLVYTSREFHPPNRTLDERFWLVGPSLDTRAPAVDFPWEQLGPRVVYISLGTVTNTDPTFYRACFEAFRAHPAQFVLSVGQSTDIGTLGAIPGNFIVRQRVPQLAVLERADAFITHGGMNSVHEGLIYGVPEIVVPHQLEQLLNGLRVAQVGAGLLLGEKPPYGRVTAGQLAEALDNVLNDPGFRAQAARYGAALRAAGGGGRAADEIEGFLEAL